MSAPELGMLILLVAAWAAVGVGLAIAFRWAPSTTLFRLAAAFLAGWALLATTTLLWVVANGGLSGIVRLAQAPAELFEPRSALVWLGGGLGAFLVFFLAFVLSQAVGRGFLAALRPRPLSWPEALPPPATPTSLLAFPSARREAFSFTLLERGARGGFRRRDVILVSDGLLERLTPVEQEAVVAHEWGHIRELDGRYLTFFRTLARMMRWDPVLALLADSLTSREEFRADGAAVELTRRPRALARALYKASALAPPRAAAGLFGAGGRRGRRQAVERIRRLVALAESGRYPEEPGV
jgi:Zn-dependent protease with chaperone function